MGMVAARPPTAAERQISADRRHSGFREGCSPSAVEKLAPVHHDGAECLIGTASVDKASPFEPRQIDGDGATLREPAACPDQARNPCRRGSDAGRELHRTRTTKASDNCCQWCRPDASSNASSCP